MYVPTTLPDPVPVTEAEEEEEAVVEEGRKPGRQRANSSYTDACCCDGPPTYRAGIHIHVDSSAVYTCRSYTMYIHVCL